MLRQATKRLVIGTAGLAIGLAGLGGCSTSAENARLADANKVLTSRNQELQASLDDARRTNAALSGSGDARSSTIASLQERNRQLEQLVNEQAAAMRDFEGRFAGLGFSPLDATTDRMLRDLANQYPGLVTYDPQRGMLRFASDLTFDLGSDAVRPQARQSLAALAEVLKSGSGAGYEVRVVGHTDNVRIGSATAQRHPTNMHLSAHRAISVRRELVSLGVPEAKIQAAGWGEHRPAVPNSATGGTEQNRRVEIFLVADTGSGMSPGSAGSTGGAGSMTPTGGQMGVDRDRPGRQPDPTK